MPEHRRQFSPQFKAENEFANKQRPASRGRTRSRAVHGHRRGEGHYKIAWRCQVLSVPDRRSVPGVNRAETATAARRRDLAVLVTAAFETGRGVYGCRRVTAALNRDGHPCSVGLVADLMRELRLRACQPEQQTAR
jgi:putative transposase